MKYLKFLFFLLLLIVFYGIASAESVGPHAYVSFGLYEQTHGVQLQDVFGDDIEDRYAGKVQFGIKYRFNSTLSVGAEYTRFTIMGTVDQGIGFTGVAATFDLF